MITSNKPYLQLRHQIKDGVISGGTLTMEDGNKQLLFTILTLPKNQYGNKVGCAYIIANSIILKTFYFSWLKTLELI